MPFVDYYKVLQVDPEADADVIQAAYRTLARKYHPDVASTREAAEKMSALNVAWQMLRSAERRAAYDQVRAERLNGRAPQQTDSVATPEPTGTRTGWPEGRTGFRRFDPKSRTRPGEPPGRPSGTVLDFGRYKGWSLGEIAKHDPAFLEWFVRMPIARPYVREINELLDAQGRKSSEAKPAPEPQKKGLFRR